MAFTRLEPTGVNTSATFTFANVSVTGNITSAGVSNLGPVTNVIITGGSPNYVLKTDGAGGLSWAAQTGGSGTYSNANVESYLPTYTGNVSASYFIGDGSQLTNIPTGTAVTVTGNSQPNITSVGTLSSLAVSGITTLGNAQDSAVVTVGNASSSTDRFLQINSSAGVLQLGTDGITGAYLMSFADNPLTFYTNDTPYVEIANTGETSVLSTTESASKITGALKVAGGVGVVGNVFANYFSGNGSLLTGVIATRAGTVTSNAQPNITSVGSLSNLTVSGDATVTGNLTVSGSYTYANVTSFNVKDPIIEQGGNPNGTPLASNDGKDRGQLLHYYSSGAIDAFMGWDNSNAEFGLGSNVSVSSDVVTFNTYGNLRAGYIIGNGSQLTSITGSSVTGYVPLANAANTATSATSATTAGTVTTASQPNITSTGTLTSLTVSGLITATSGGIKVGNLQDPSGTNTIQLLNSNITVTGNIVAGGSGSGNVTATYFIGNGSQLTGLPETYSNTQVAAYLPTYTGNISASNITATGIVNFNSTSNVSLGSNANVHITGGTTGQYLKTDGSGGLSWGGAPNTINYYSRSYNWAGPVTVNTGTQRLYLPVNSTLINAYFNLATAGTTNTVITTNKNGSSIDSTTMGNAVANTTTSFNTSMAINDYLTVDVTTAGAGAVDLYVTYVFTTT